MDMGDDEDPMDEAKKDDMDEAKKKKGDDKEDKALQERFQKLANIIKG